MMLLSSFSSSMLPSRHLLRFSTSTISSSYGTFARAQSASLRSSPRQGVTGRFTNARRRALSGERSSGDKPEIPTPSTFMERFLATKPMPPRNTPRWYAEMVLLCTVFGITGSSTMFLVRPATTEVLGLQGSFKDGPWSYRICSVVIMTPIYSTLLVIVGTVFGRHAYFRHFAVKMFSRFGIPAELMDKNFHRNAKNFRKW